jgi:hypothetical protein
MKAKQRINVLYTAPGSTREEFRRRSVPLVVCRAFVFPSLDEQPDRWALDEVLGIVSTDRTLTGRLEGIAAVLEQASGVGVRHPRATAIIVAVPAESVLGLAQSMKYLPVELPAQGDVSMAYGGHAEVHAVETVSKGTFPVVFFS